MTTASAADIAVVVVGGTEFWAGRITITGKHKTGSLASV